MSCFLRELLYVERNSGHAKKGRYIRGKLDSASPKSSRRGRRVESSMVDS
ncbi:hypothetical protein Gotur_006198 [Gossypium turneri]